VKSCRAVVFDLDDTLYPERDFVLGGFRAAARWAEEHLGLEANEGYLDLCRLYQSGVRGDTFDRWIGGQGLDCGAIVPRLVHVYREHHPSLEPYPGVRELLERIRLVHRVGLLSDGFLSVQRRKVDALGIEPLFDAIVFSDEWGWDAWKPSTRPYVAVLQQLKVPAGSAIYVADNPRKDFLGARQIGMQTVQVRRPGGEYAFASPPTADHAADVVVEDLEDLCWLRGGRS